MLPSGVQKVTKPSGRVYYFYAPGRGTKNPGKRIALGSDTTDPEFWRRLREASTPIAVRDGTLSRLIAEYRRTRHGPTCGQNRSASMHISAIGSTQAAAIVLSPP